MMGLKIPKGGVSNKIESYKGGQMPEQGIFFR